MHKNRILLKLVNCIWHRFQSGAETNQLSRARPTVLYMQSSRRVQTSYSILLPHSFSKMKAFISSFTCSGWSSATQWPASGMCCTLKLFRIFCAKIGISPNSRNASLSPQISKVGTSTSLCFAWGSLHGHTEGSIGIWKQALNSHRSALKLEPTLLLSPIDLMYKMSGVCKNLDAMQNSSLYFVTVLETVTSLFHYIKGEEHSVSENI